VLDDEEVGGRVRGGDFECERTEAERVEMAGAVLAGGDGMERGPGGGAGAWATRSCRAAAGAMDAKALRNERRWACIGLW